MASVGDCCFDELAVAVAVDDEDDVELARVLMGEERGAFIFAGYGDDPVGT